MKKSIISLFIFLFFSPFIWAQNPVNWTPKDLMEPADLAELLTSGKDRPLILSVGPGATIPHSVHVGPTKDAESLSALKKELAALTPSSPVVIYCGCCPFEHCPNVRPAIALLQELKFTNYKLLNIPKNLKADWIDKGYPTAKQ